MRGPLVLGLLTTFADWAAVVGLATAVGGALGAPLSRFPKLALSVGDAAAWGLTWGLAAGISWR
jgi:hypothetical protein